MQGGDISLVSDAQKQAAKRYKEKATLNVSVSFNRNTEPELFDMMQAQENRAGFIKSVLMEKVERDSR